MAAIDDAELVVGDLVLNQTPARSPAAVSRLTSPQPSSTSCRYLMENAKRVVSKSQILDNVWNYDFGGQANIVELYISYLRKKIDVRPRTDDSHGARCRLRLCVRHCNFDVVFNVSNG